MDLIFRLLNRCGLIQGFFPWGGGGAQLPQITNSLRCNEAASQYLSKVVATLGDQKTFTINGKLKRTKFGANQTIFSSYTDSNNWFAVYFLAASEKIAIACLVGGVVALDYVTTSAVYRDPIGHYDICLGIDTTHATATSRIALEVNGQTIPLTASTTVAQNTNILNWVTRNIGSSLSTNYLGGYLSYFSFIGGAKLPASSFSYTDPNNQWRSKPKSALVALAAAGGTNSCFLPFDDGTSTTTLGQDASGNGNHWTLTNFTRSAGVNDCWSLDTPTTNFATLNPIFSSPATAFSNGNLTITKTATVDTAIVSTMAMLGGKWYWEIKVNSLNAPQNFGFGVVKISKTTGVWEGGMPLGVYFGGLSAVVRYGTSLSSSNNFNAVTGSTICCSLDMDNGTLSVTRDGAVPTYSTITGLDTTTPHYAFIDTYESGESLSINFGQRAFTYAPPTGFKSLCTANIPAPTGAAAKPWEHFDIALWNGDGTASRNISSSLDVIDLVVGKSRSNAYDNESFDSVRGYGLGKDLSSNLTQAEGYNSTLYGGVTAAGSKSFTLTKGSNALNTWNNSGSSFVAWLYRAGGAAVTNNAGSIASQVSANVAAGFSIVTFTGNLTAGATVGHGLGKALKRIVLFDRTLGGRNHIVYDSSIGNTKGLYLNLTNPADGPFSQFWNNTDPNSTVFTVSAWTNENASNYVAYCFAEIDGYSKFGSYAGKGSDVYVHCGFRPRYIRIKRIDVAGNWIVFDTSRDQYNPTGQVLYPNLATIEQTFSPFGDIVSNGFVIKNSATDFNASGGLYIYEAISEAHFKYANAR